MQRDQIRLSKTISHALRHAPAQYGLTLDADGWVSVADLLHVLHARHPAWSRLTADDLARLNEAAEKTRFEIRDGRIRARYGHSTGQRIALPPASPPPILYHGTSVRYLSAIRREGLRPMRRQYVHLSADRATAQQVAARRRGDTAILAVDTHAAQQAGIRFYRGNNDIWLSDPIPPGFVAFDEDNVYQNQSHS